MELVFSFGLALVLVGLIRAHVLTSRALNRLERHRDSRV